MKTRTEYQSRSEQQIELQELGYKVMEVLDIADRLKESTGNYDLTELTQKLEEIEDQIEEMRRSR